MAALLDVVKKGSVNRSVTIRIIDSTAGTPETGVAWNTPGIDLWFRREGAAVASITEAALSALTDAHADGGFLHVSDGEYRLDVPDAAFATGAQHVDVGGTVTGMVVIGGRVRLVDYDPEAAVPEVNLKEILGTVLTETSGGYLAAAFKKLFDVAAPTLVASDVMRGTNSAAPAATALSTATWTAARAGVLTDWIDGGRLDQLLDAIPTSLANADLQKIKQQEFNRPAWYVSQLSGNDGNSGTAAGDAFLTIGAALTAASSGDLILVAKGAYTEKVDLATAGLTGIEIWGTARGEVTITHATDGEHAIYVTDDTTLRNLTVVSTGTNSAGVSAWGAVNNVELDNVDVTGVIDGVLLNNSDNVWIHHSVIRSPYDGLNLGGVQNFLVEFCHLIGTAADTNALSRAFLCANVGQDPKGVVRNTRLEVNRLTDGTLDAGDRTSAAYVSAGQVVFDGVTFAASSVDANYAGTVSGIETAGGIVSIKRSTFITSNAAAGDDGEDIRHTAGTITVDSACEYDTTKTSGTVTNLGEVAVDLGLDNGIPASPTADSVNQRLKAIDVLTEAAGDGDLAAILADTGELQTNQGNWLTASGFSTHDAAAVITALKASSFDTITFESLMECLLAVLSGVATVSGNDVSFKKRDGSTSKITISMSAVDGARTASVIDG